MTNNNDKKLQFNEALAFLIETANINSGKVTLDDIHKTFDGIIEEDSMYQFIYNYLLENKITIQDYINHPSKSSKSDSNSDSDSNSNPDPDSDFNFDFNSNSDFNFNSSSQDSDNNEHNEPNSFTANEHDEEKAFVNMYLDEIANHDTISAEEELELLLELLSLTYVDSNNTVEVNTADVNTANSKNDSSKTNLRNRLIENNLSLVVSQANSYAGGSVTMGDLLQEGNLGLIEGVNTYIPTVFNTDNYIFDKTIFNLNSLEEFKSHLNACIVNALDDAVAEQDTAARLSSHLVDRANALDNASIILAKELGRTPTIEEIASHLSITVEEAQSIMKMSLDALTTDGADAGDADDQSNSDTPADC